MPGVGGKSGRDGQQPAPSESNGIAGLPVTGGQATVLGLAIAGLVAVGGSLIAVRRNRAS